MDSHIKWMAGTERPHGAKVISTMIQTVLQTATGVAALITAVLGIRVVCAQLRAENAKIETGTRASKRDQPPKTRLRDVQLATPGGKLGRDAWTVVLFSILLSAAAGVASIMWHIDRSKQVETLIERAKDNEARGELGAALMLYEKAIGSSLQSADPESMTEQEKGAYMAAGTAMAKFGRTADAVIVFERLHRNDPADAFYLMNLARALAHLPNDPLAWKKGAELLADYEPPSPEIAESIHLTRGTLYALLYSSAPGLDETLLDKAIADLGKVISQPEDQIRARYNTACLYSVHGGHCRRLKQELKSDEFLAKAADMLRRALDVAKATQRLAVWVDAAQSEKELDFLRESFSPPMTVKQWFEKQY